MVQIYCNLDEQFKLYSISKIWKIDELASLLNTTIDGCMHINDTTRVYVKLETENGPILRRCIVKYVLRRYIRIIYC
jgi:hypothetical protein